MKVGYKKPVIEFEKFELNENIAACDQPVLFGPEQETSACGDYGFGGDVQPFALNRTPFYDNSGCQCYYTAPEGAGYFGKS